MSLEIHQELTARLYEGAVVRLKSGGPAMTIASIQASGITHCKWFDEGCCAREGLFEVASLREIG